MPQLWEIVGGVDKGGILVREGQDLKSPQAAERVSTGATVEELQLIGERLEFKLLEGTGPAKGWVSISLSGKVLCQRKEQDLGPVEAPDFEELKGDYAYLKGDTAATPKTTWFKQNGKAKPDAKARIMIFPWTGNRGGQGSAHNFVKMASPNWAEILKDYEVFEVNYTGRGMRMKDALISDHAKLCKDVCAEFEKTLAGGRPTVFLGFSFGSILAFECARIMQEKSLGPMCVVAVSAEGPRWTGRKAMGMAKMNEETFEKMLWDKGGTEFILKEPSMKKMYVPVIKNDVILEEGYRYDPSTPLKCPILEFHGTAVGHDQMKTLIKDDDAKLWLEVTSCKEKSQMCPMPLDWYIFQDPNGCDHVGKTIAEFCAPLLK